MSADQIAHTFPPGRATESLEAIDNRETVKTELEP